MNIKNVQFLVTKFKLIYYSCFFISINKVTETSYTIMYLTAGNKYRFRVKAVNVTGIGKPSEATDEITAKEPFSKLARLSTRRVYLIGIMKTWL